MNLSYNKLSFWSLMLGLLSVMSIPSVSLGATKGVTVGCAGAQCLGAGIGFVDDTSGTGGFAATAVTNIAAGDTVHWHWEAGGQHTVTSQAAPGGNAPAACGTGDTFNSGILPAPGSIFDHPFSTVGTCSYFCQVHSAAQMQGDVIVASSGSTTTTSTVTTSTTTTSSAPVSTTTSSAPVSTTTSSSPVSTTTSSAPVSTTTSSTPVTTTSTVLGSTTTSRQGTTTTSIARTTTTVRVTTTTIRRRCDDDDEGPRKGKGKKPKKCKKNNGQHGNNGDDD